MTATVLLPQSPRIDLIGGEGREFEVDGKNYPLNRKLNDAYTPGVWRAEVTGGNGETRRFLTLLSPADIDAPSEAPVALEESRTGFVIRQGDLAVALARPNQRITIDAPRVIHVELAG